jgi:hypothetical protein
MIPVVIKTATFGSFIDFITHALEYDVGHSASNG